MADATRISFLRLPSDKNLVHNGYNLIATDSYTLQTTSIDCIAQRLEMIYIGADGYVFPCGFLADRCKFYILFFQICSNSNGFHHNYVSSVQL